MAELLVELFSEEVPARMQAGAAEALARLVGEALGALTPAGVVTYAGPRRIALAATVADGVAAFSSTERGPRVTAPAQALDGFLRKHGAARDQVAEENGHWVLTRSVPATPAAMLVAAAMPGVLRRFPWPKSMRWGQDSAFTWVRPLRRIVCLLDGAVVPFALSEGADDAHGLHSGNETEGHRFHAPAAFAVRGATDWRDKLLARFVVPEAAERRRRISDGIERLAAAEGLRVVADDGLLDEVAGLCEWPVPLLGRIDAGFMDLPPEVMQVSMRVNQRYFALRTADGAAVPRFAFAANIEATDGGAAIVAGNERVLRARFSDARHFWDLDRKTKLADRLPALEGITFHAKLGTQAERVARIEGLARVLAPLVGADAELAARAARLCKADLVTGMVGEFPELQGVMGGYYAAHDGEDPAVAAAVREHYAPRGPSDRVPVEPVSVAVALADKLDQLASFFAVGELPTGSSDPYALRRAALGIVRLILENDVSIPLRFAFSACSEFLEKNVPIERLIIFIAERLRIQLRSLGARHDILAAVFARKGAQPEDDLMRLMARTEAVTRFLESNDGHDLLVGAKRAANIVRIENAKDGPHSGPTSYDLYESGAELAIDQALNRFHYGANQHPAGFPSQPCINDYTKMYDYDMKILASLRPGLDAFFNEVIVNSLDPAIRQNRLRLLARVCEAMDLAADFTHIEG